MLREKVASLVTRVFYPAGLKNSYYCTVELRQPRFKSGGNSGFVETRRTKPETVFANILKTFQTSLEVGLIVARLLPETVMGSNRTVLILFYSEYLRRSAHLCSTIDRVGLRVPEERIHDSICFKHIHMEGVPFGCSHTCKHVNTIWNISPSSATASVVVQKDMWED